MFWVISNGLSVVSFNVKRQIYFFYSIQSDYEQCGVHLQFALDLGIILHIDFGIMISFRRMGFLRKVFVHWLEYHLVFDIGTEKL